MRKLIAAIIGIIFAGSLAAQQTTPNIGLVEPQAGAVNWGPIMNANLVKIDSAFGCSQSWFQGTWSSSVTYCKGQAVIFGGNLWVSLVNSNLNNSPASGPYWVEALITGSSAIDQLTGDVLAGPGGGSQVATLATVNSSPGSCGDSTHVCQVTTNGKGLTISQSQVAITGGGGSPSGPAASVQIANSSVTGFDSDSSITIDKTAHTLNIGGALPATHFTLNNLSTITASWTFDVTSPTTALNSLTGTQSANTVLAGPASGSAANPTFRALVSADIPAINLAASGNGGVIGGAVSGQYLSAVNGAAPVFLSPGSPGANGGATITSNYTVACDSSTAIADRARILQLTNSSAITVTVPDTTSTGCAGNFFFGINAAGVGAVTVNRTTSSTFNVYNGSSATMGATSFTLSQGQYATVANLVGTAYDVRVSSGSTTVNPVVGFIILSGSTGTNVGPYIPASRSGSFTKCFVVVKTSDGSTGLTFKVNQNGTDIFTTNPTISAGTSAGSTFTFTALTSSPLSVTQNDLFTIDITSGTTSWAFTVTME